MCAAPFGPHPTFSDYIEWAIEQGCNVNSGLTADGDGDPFPITKIETRDGKRWVIEAGTRQSDRLAPTTVGRFDRRLGLKSPFPSLPDGDDDD